MLAAPWKTLNLFSHALAYPLTESGTGVLWDRTKEEGKMALEDLLMESRAQAGRTRSKTKWLVTAHHGHLLGQE